MPTPRLALALGPTEWLLLLLLSVLWGGTFMLVEIALVALPPLTIVLARVGLAALTLQLILPLLGYRMPWGAGIWAAFLVMGMLNNAVPFSLLFWGQTEITSGLAAILTAMVPIFTLLLGHWLTDDERLTPWRGAGALLGLAGVAVMIGPSALGGLGRELYAQLAVLGAALSYAFAGIYGRRFRAQPPIVVAAGQVTCSTVLMLPPVLWLERPWHLPLPDAGPIAAVVSLAVVNTALAYILYFRILKTAGATNLLLVAFLAPASAVVLGVLVLHETLAPEHLLGMALIALGLAAVDGRPLALLRQRRRAAGT